MKSRKITELTSNEAKNFFREEKSYVNFDLPEYFHFSDLLTVAYGALFEKKFKKDICIKEEKNTVWPKECEKVNYAVLGNKDGAYSWREFQLIHPILYVDLVNFITFEKHWEIVTNRFSEFSKGIVECISIPRISSNQDSNRATQVIHWWEEMEQRSIKLALKYNYVFSTDIENCYPSIYTHSIEWALSAGGKKEAKDNLKKSKSTKSHASRIGEEIDLKIRNMNSGQTTGIPQGSVLMDFIAEMVLGYADLLLTESIRKKFPLVSDFCILRYRDDYKIFVNDPVLGHEFLRELNSVLYGLNLKMSPGKTSRNDDVILSSIKPAKLERISTAPISQHYQKEALRIYQISKRHPNSGIIVKELSEFYDRIVDKKRLKNTDIEVLISIFSMIAIGSPKHINWVSAVVSKLLEILDDKEKSMEIIKAIHNKFKNIPHTSFIDIWLQRISAPLKIDVEYTDPLSMLACHKISNSDLWNSDWLNKDIVQMINNVKISTLPEELDRNELPAVISRSEVELFRQVYN